jgi:hypothetical protein
MSVGIKFLYQFAVGEYDLNNPGSNVLSVTSTAAGFDKKNLTTSPLREVWRSTTSISGYQDIVFQANDPSVVIDTFAILNHNLSSTAVVQVQGSLTSSFTAPAFTLAFTWSEKHMVLLNDIGTAYNYYRVRILDPSNPCGFLEIGRIIAGRSFTFTNNEDITDSISIATQDLASKTKTEGFFRAFNQRVKVDTLSISFSKLKTLTGENANYAGLMAMFKAVGETYPFLTILDPSDQSFLIHWGIIDRLPSRSYGINRYVDMQLAIAEIY